MKPIKGIIGILYLFGAGLLQRIKDIVRPPRKGGLQ